MEGPDEEAVCVCDEGYEGGRCETAINEKFIGDSYTVTETTSVGGNSLYICSVKAGARESIIIFDNLVDLQIDFVAEISQEQTTSFAIRNNVLQNGNVIGGTGRIISSNNEIVVDYFLFQVSTNDTLFVKARFSR